MPSIVSNLGATAFFVFAARFMMDAVSFNKYMQALPENNGKFPEGYAWPKLDEFLVTAASTVVYIILERIFIAILPQFFVGIVSAKSNESKKVKLDKMA